MRKPLTNIRYATDNFNWLNRLNHRYQIGKLNTGANKKNSYSNHLYNMGFWRDWKPECDLYCQPCVPEKVKTKLFNRNPIRYTFKKVFCLPIVYELKIGSADR